MKKEHHILFSTPMVQAIMQGRKTQTRRVMKPQPHYLHDMWFYTKNKISYGLPDGKEICTELLGIWDVCPYDKVSGLLWVKETFYYDVISHPEGGYLDQYLFKADYTNEQTKRINK